RGGLRADGGDLTAADQDVGRFPAERPSPPEQVLRAAALVLIGHCPLFPFVLRCRPGTPTRGTVRKSAAAARRRPPAPRVALALPDGRLGAAEEQVEHGRPDADAVGGLAGDGGPRGFGDL